MYCGYVTRLKNVRKHPNADRLVLADVFDSTVVVGQNSQEGEIVIYFPCDGQLSEEYCEYNNLIRKKDEFGNNIGGFLEPDKRNVKAIKLRGERSDGLVMPLSSLDYIDEKLKNKLNVGDQISTLNGKEICRKYIPKTSKRNGTCKPTKKDKRKVDEFPLFEEHKDTAQLDFNISAFKPGDLVELTLKMHGTSGRTGYLPSSGKGFLQKLYYKIKPHYKYISGTRRVVLQDFDGGFYGDNAFRATYHNFFKGKLRKGETVYYEIVGYVNETTPIMGIANNKKMNDKEFVKKYGETTTFSYGCKPGENKMYVYRMTYTSFDGTVIEYPWSLVKRRCEEMGATPVMDLDRFIYTNEQDLYARIDKWLDIDDPIGRTHVDEGVVARIEDRASFTAFKKKSFAFRVLEGIIKENADAPDMEEAQEVEEENNE